MKWTQISFLKQNGNWNSLKKGSKLKERIENDRNFNESKVNLIQSEIWNWNRGKTETEYQLKGLQKAFILNLKKISVSVSALSVSTIIHIFIHIMFEKRNM